MRLGVFASHGGTNLQAIMDACKQGTLNAEVCVVVSNNSKSLAMERAKGEGIPTYHLSGKTHPEPVQLDNATIEALQSHKVELVVLAGYMKKLGPQVLDRYDNRILNSHPALLPKFGGKGMYGDNVHSAVLAAGEDMTGITIHLADDEYDQGPIIAQCEVAVLNDDTVESLSERVKGREHAFWIETLQKIADGQIDLKMLARQEVPSN